MKKILLLAFTILFCSYFVNAQVTGTIGSVQANPGEEVNIPVTFNGLNGDNSPIAIDFKFDYDNTQLTPVGTGFANYCTEMPQTDWLPNPNYGPNTMSNNMALIYPVSVPDNTVIFELTFTYNGTTTADVTFNLETIIFNGNFDELQPVYTNGGVTPLSQPIQPPVLNLPTNGAIDVVTNPNLSWFAVENATSYTLQVSTASDFSSFVINQNGITDLDYDLSGLNYLTTYYWRANATDGTETSDWSEVWNFTTEDEGPVELAGTISTVQAEPGQTVYVPVTFWGLNGDNAPIAIDFKFDYDNTQLTPVGTGFANYCTQIPQSDWLPNPNYGPNTMSNNMALIYPVDVPNGTVIFELVFTYNGTTTANITFNPETIIFNGNFDELQPIYTNGAVEPTTINPPLAPVLLSPVNELADVNINVTLEWNASLTATGYNIEISDDPTFATTIALQSTTTTVDVLGLNYLTPYYWRVNAYNNGGTSDWSEVWMFTTMDEEPTVLTGKIYTVEAELGQTVYVPVRFWKLNGDDAPIAIDFKFDYDATQLTPVGTGFANYCAEIPQSDWLPNPNYGPNTMSNNMALIYPVDVPDGTKLFDLVFTYNGPTNAEIIFNLETIIFNGNFDELQPVYINGAVIPSEPPVPPLPPVLVSPIDGSVDMPNPIEFTWMASEGATQYYIEFSDVEDFSNAWGEWTTETSYLEDFWYYATTYYWRVKASNGLESDWSEVWDVTITEFGVPTLVSPIDEAADVDINPTLTWELVPEADGYNIEISDDPTFATTIALQSQATSIQILGLNYLTPYYWRVNAYDEYQAGEWSTVWMFTTIQQEVPPAPPVLVSPLNETIDIPVVSLTLDWNASNGADYYNIEVATNEAFENASEYETVETSIDIYNLEYLTTYYWRVNATNQNGTGDWSEVWMFTTAPFIPPAPVLCSPENGAINIPLQSDLTWYASDGADSYTIEVSWLEDFSETFGTTTTELTYAADFWYNNYTYYWRVKATAGNFDSEWSTVWSLTTEPLPVPVLVSPLNGATGIDNEGTDLSWNIELPAILSYYEVATDINFTEVLFSGWTDGTTVFVGELAYETEYFWHVKAKNEYENESDFSETWSFITEEVPVPAPPVLVSPVNGTIDVPPAEVEFNWEVVETAVEYYFELAHDADFTEIHYSGSIIVNEITLYNLEPEDTFYWRVNATNDLGGTSVWSEVWMFTTSEAEPFIWTTNTGNNATVIIPYLATPTINTVPLTDGDWVGAYSPLGFCVGAVEWTIQPPPQTGNGITVWGDNDQTPITDGMIVGQTIAYQLYKAETQTYYPVPAENVSYSQGNGIYAVNGYYVVSEMSYTDNYFVPKVVLTSPYDDEVDVVIDPATVFTWEAADNATMYNIEVSTDPNFTYTIAEQTAETSFEVPGLLDNTMYYWRVNGFNDNYTGEWSDIWNFTTEEVIPCEPPTVQARSLIFSSVTDNSIKVRWTRGNGEMALVVAYPNGVDGTPEQLTGYIADSEYGLGSMIGTGYVVYSGIGDRVTVTGLLGGHLYTFKVYEFNYTECIAYLFEDGSNNPRSKSTLPPNPVILPLSLKTDTGFMAEWTYNGEVDWFEIYLYNDLGNLIDIIDVGDETSLFIDELTPATLYYYQIIANYGGSYSFSEDAPAVATLDVEPITAPTNMEAELGLIDNTVNLTWDVAIDAESYLVVAYTSDPTGMPMDATEYEFDADYSLAPVLGDGKVVYVGMDNFTTVTGLEQFAEYFFRVYAFNGGVEFANTYPLNTHNYNVEEYGATNIWNVVLPAPVMLIPDSKWEEGFSIYWTYEIDPDYFELDANGEVFDLPVDLRSFDIDGLLPNTLYSVKIRAIYSEITSEWSNIEQITTLAIEPAQPTDLVFTNVTDVSATLTWTKAIDAEKTLVLAHQLGLTGEPVDNFGYPAGNSAYGDLTQMIDNAFIVYNGTGNTFELTGLEASGIYYFELFAYNGDGVLGDDILNSFNYNVDEPLLGELQTSVSAPTVPPTSVIFPVIGTTQMDVAWTPGNGTNSIVLAKTNDAPFTVPANGISYNGNLQFGLGDMIGDAYVVYVGTEANVTVTGLAEGTEYYFAVYTFNGFGGGTVYLDIPALGNETTKAPAPEPLGQDRVISFRNSQATQVNLTWLLPTTGAGDHRLALVKAETALTIDDFPVDGMTYTANATFGLGDQVGNAYAIYNGAAVPTIANPLTVTGLTTGTTYHFRVFAYNVIEPGTENYNLNGAVFNPREKTAGSREAVAGDENDGYEGNALFNLSSIAPNPVKDVINFTMNVYDAQPMSIEVYNADGLRVLSVQDSKSMSIGEHSFSIPTGNIAAGFYILKVSTGSSEFAIQSFIVMP